MDKQTKAIFKRTQAEFPRLMVARVEQVVKWGEDDVKSPFHLLTILGEEYGELCKAILEGNMYNAHEEALHTAAVALAIAEQMTKDIEFERAIVRNHEEQLRRDYVNGDNKTTQRKGAS